MDETKINIAEKYRLEIQTIHNLLNQLENGRVMGYRGNNVNSDGSLEHNAKKLKEMIGSLLSKIQNGKESDLEKLSGSLNKIDE